MRVEWRLFRYVEDVRNPNLVTAFTRFRGDEDEMYHARWLDANMGGLRRARHSAGLDHPLRVERIL